MYKLQLIVFCLLSCCYAFGQAPDADKDGVPNIEDVCPDVAGPKSNKGCPENSSDKVIALKEELSAEDKKILIANFQKVLQHIPSKFEKLKTGDEDWDITNRISWYKSNLQLFPNHTDKSKTQLMYGMYSGKPVIAFIENAPADVNTIVQILAPVLKAKGMIEVNTKFVINDPAARSFRSKDAVLQINTGSSARNAVLNIGKLPYYYEADVKPISAVKPKPVVAVQAKNEIVELKQAILKANEAVKKNKSNPFTGFATTKTGKNILFAASNECVWQVKNMFNTVIPANNEICIQATTPGGEHMANLYSNPCQQLALTMGPGYKVNFDNGDTYMATFENVSITYSIMQGQDYQYAPFIFIRPRNIATAEEEIKEDASSVFITPDNLRIILKDICENAMHLQKGEGQPVAGRTPTRLSKNGKQKNLPVTYNLSPDDKVLKVFIPLSGNKKDFDAILKYVNELFVQTTACSGNYKKLKLEKDAKQPNTANGAEVFDDYGLTVSLKENIVSAKETSIELTIIRINLNDNKPANNNPVQGSGPTCSDFNTILNEAENNFTKVKGKKEKFVNAFESHYYTSLPLLGANEGRLVEEYMDGKNTLHYQTLTYKPTQELLSYFSKITQVLEKCISLIEKTSDSQKGNTRTITYAVPGNDGREYYINFELTNNGKGEASLRMYFYLPDE